MEYTVNLGKESLKKIANAIGGVDVQELEVTQNGVYTAPDGKAYSPVKVNVAGEGGGGSSDFSTAKVTLGGSIGFSGSYLFGTPADLSKNFLSANLSLSSSNPTRTIILYNGHGTVALQSTNLSVSGDAEIIQVDMGGQTIPAIDITGNCTITLTE